MEIKNILYNLFKKIPLIKCTHEQVFKKASEHIQNENIVKTIQLSNEIEIGKISEKIEPNANLKHARVIAQPLQRNSSVSTKKKFEILISKKDRINFFLKS